MPSDTVTIPKYHAANVSGPASYAAGGFLVDLSATFSNLGYLELTIETVGALPPVHYEIARNQDLSGAFAPGKAAVKLMRDRYDEFTTGNVSGQPSGVTVQASKTATGTTTGSSHTHAIDHDHQLQLSDIPNAAGAGVNAAAGGDLSEHTHDVDLPNLVVSSGASTHTHQRSFEYDHNHSFTDAETAVISTEIAALTNLSTTTWRILAVGF